MEDHVGNLTALFNAVGASHNESDILTYKDLCENNTQCLLAIARADSIDAGQLLMDRIQTEKIRKAKTGKSLARQRGFSEHVQLPKRLINIAG